MINETRISYLLVIDTDSLANFDREMGAYCTGMAGERGVGDAEAGEFKGEQLPHLFDDILLFKLHSDGCKYPALMWPTRGLYNNGFGFHFKDGEEKIALRHCELLQRIG